VIQQTVLAMFPALLGSSGHRLPGSPQRLFARLNAALRDEADDAGMLDDRFARDGLTAWRRLRRVAGGQTGTVAQVSGA
jgi:hypothetical protein